MLLKDTIEKELKSLLSTEEAKSIIWKATWDDEDYTIRFKITNESMDRDGETIKAEWIDWKHFDNNPVFLIDHNYAVWSIAGKVINRETTGTETYLTVVLAKGIPAGELVKSLHTQWMIKWVSIGFMPLQRDANDRSIIIKSEALEASAVAIGSNREALMDEKSAQICKELGVFKEVSEEKATDEEKKEDAEIDLKSIFNMMKELKEEISTLSKDFASLKTQNDSSDDKEKEEKALEESRETARLKAKKSWQDFIKDLSVLLRVEK